VSYQVIARKYRPQRFEDVVGQEHVTTTLMNAVRSGRIAHAYLFCGPRGTGKTTLARIFAKALNATGGPRVDFTEDDPRVKEIAEGRSMEQDRDRIAFPTFEDGLQSNRVVEAITRSARAGGVWTPVAN